MHVVSSFLLVEQAISTGQMRLLIKQTLMSKCQNKAIAFVHLSILG
ncbi:hypothetical protein NY10_1386 [Carnobacterium antarcticum]|nr:hypothetical protein NY10_1386 [Carnobacterium sp. CP1]